MTGKTEVVSLLERFKSDPSKTRSEVRLELGITNGQAVSTFSYYLFLISHLFFFFFLSQL